MSKSAPADVAAAAAPQLEGLEAPSRHAKPRPMRVQVVSIAPEAQVLNNDDIDPQGEARTVCLRSRGGLALRRPLLAGVHTGMAQQGGGT